MGDTAKICPSVPSSFAQHVILSLPIIRDCKAMGDAAKISPRVPSTYAQNAIVSLLIYTSLQVPRSMWLLTIHHSFRPSPVLQIVAISGMTGVKPTIFPTQKTCKAPAAGGFLTCTNFETRSKFH